MFRTNKQTMYNETILAKRNLNPIVNGASDSQDHRIILCSYLVQMALISYYHFS